MQAVQDSRQHPWAILFTCARTDKGTKTLRLGTKMLKRHSRPIPTITTHPHSTGTIHRPPYHIPVPSQSGLLSVDFCIGIGIGIGIPTPSFNAQPRSRSVPPPFHSYELPLQLRWRKQPSSTCTNGSKLCLTTSVGPPLHIHTH
ncbi:hypothetical protein CF326_g5952 [Tilletia indica]|nr:hypothetical protein CF326_g5952 [Tilletia indica]